MSPNGQLRIAILGAGNVGAALGRRLSEVGEEVFFGVRPGTDVSALLADCGPRARAGSAAEAVAGADMVILAVPAAAALEVAREAGGLAGKIVIDATNPVGWADGPTLEPPSEGSVAAALAVALPGAQVVKGFNTFGAEHHRDPGRTGVPITTFLAGDDADAKAGVASLAERAGFAPVDVGPLRNAAWLESVALVWIQLAIRGGLGRGIALQLVGRQT